MGALGTGGETGNEGSLGGQALSARPTGCRTNLVRHEGGDGTPELMVVSAGVAGPQHHEKEANRHRDLEHGLQEYSLVQPHEGCCWLLQERHTAWGRIRHRVLGAGEWPRQALEGKS